MKTPQGRTIWNLSIVIIVISGIELIFAVLLAIGLSMGTATILQSTPMRNMANNVCETLESASIEVGSVDISVQSQDGTSVTYSNIPNIDPKKLKLAGVLDENGRFIGDAASRVATGIVSIGITAATVAAILAIFTFIAGAITLVNSGKSRKLGTVFGWSVGSGILCLIVGRLVLAVLFIIMAVCAHKGKSAPQQPIPNETANQPAAG